MSWVGSKLSECYVSDNIARSHRIFGGKFDHDKPHSKVMVAKLVVRNSENDYFLCAEASLSGRMLMFNVMARKRKLVKKLSRKRWMLFLHPWT